MEASGTEWEGKPGQELPKICVPGQEGGWFEAPEWLMAVPSPVGARRKAREGLVPRSWGGSQNNGFPCVWTPSKEVHIFHGDSARENWQGSEKARGRVSRL